jgi:ribose 5-phosphate isomerase A
MEPDSSQDKAKRAAGVQAIATYLKNGMKIGLGSGTTSRWFIHTLGDRVKQGLEVIGVPTSNSTRVLARQLGVPLEILQQVKLYGTIYGLITVHVPYGFPIISLIFRNYFPNIPE